MEKKTSRRSFLAAGLSLSAAGVPAAPQASPASAQVAYRGPRMTVESCNGVPTLFVNGKPNVGRAYYSGGVRERPIKGFGEAGVDFVSFSYSGSRGPRGSGGHAWVSRDVFDFSDFDVNMNAVLKANASAMIFPRLVLFAPKWWLDENPGDVMVYHDGTSIKPIRGGRTTALPAWSSKKWREDTALYVRKLIEHVASQPYAASVVGYHLASGGTEEWYYWPNYRWFFFEQLQDIVDYSQPQTETFREYLRRKYRTDEALRTAWHNHSVTINTAQIAPKAAKLRPDWGVFFDPAKSQQVIDSFDCESEVVADTIAYLCKVVKDATGGGAMTGAFYGYVTGAPDKAYCSTRKLLDSPYIDFLCAPSDYDFREPGAGISAYRTVARSVQLHGKLWWDENDYYTYLTPGNRYVEGWTGPPNYRTTEVVQVRQLANQLVHASPAWWFDWDSFDAPEAIELIRRLNAIAERSLYTDRRSVAEIAAVVDEKSLHCLELGWSLYRPLIQEQRMPFGRIGAPVDWILMDDLDVAPAYKMYVFLDAFHVTEAHKSATQRLYSRGAKALVWVYAPGILSTALDGKDSFTVTGLKLKLLFERSALYVEIGETGEHALPGVSRGWRYGTDAVMANSTSNKIGPIMVGDDPSATTLGMLYGIGEPGLITKVVNGAQAYFSSAPKLPGWLLRSIARRAGVHIFNDQDDALYVNKSFLGIHTPTSGKRVFRFPSPVSLYDVYERKSIADEVTEITLDMPARYSGIYFLGTGAQWDQLG